MNESENKSNQPSVLPEILPGAPEQKVEEPKATAETSPVETAVVKGPPKTKREEERDRKLTVNGHRIVELLKMTHKRGNPKDFVIIVGKRMMDYWGSYDMENKEGKTIGIEGVALIHKKELHKVVGDELASKFWSRRLGMRVAGKTLEQQAKEKEAGRAKHATEQG